MKIKFLSVIFTIFYVSYVQVNYFIQSNNEQVYNNIHLLQLINKLETYSGPPPTDQARELGYTSDNWAIAEYGELAIEPLINFINQTDRYNARFGAIFTLHLIGIELDVKTKSGIEEKFKSKLARKALLELLSYTELQEDILKLLIRDPWPSDVPYLLDYLKKDTPNTWAFVKALQRYNILNRPVHQQIPGEIANIECDPSKYQYDFPTATFEDIITYHIESKTKLLISEGGKHLQIENGLLQNQFEADAVVGYNTINVTLGGILESLTGTGFGELGVGVEYYYENGIITLCSMKTARIRWLKWYEKHKELKKTSRPVFLLNWLLFLNFPRKL